MRSAIPSFDWLKFLLSGAILPPYSALSCCFVSKLGELEHLRDMERAESAQGLLEGGQVKVDYTTGKVRHVM